MVHVGVDLHKRMSQIAVLTADGELTQHRLPNDLAHLEPLFAQLPTPSPIAIEASGTWWWLVDLLERLGHQPVLSHPKETKAICRAQQLHPTIRLHAGIHGARPKHWPTDDPACGVGLGRRSARRPLAQLPMGTPRIEVGDGLC
jgi:hypothetical protein